MAHAAGSVGKPPPNTFIEIRKPDGSPQLTGVIGEIFVRSPATMSHYLSTGEAAPHTADNAISVGDLGYLNEAGFLFLVDRKNDTIISGGVNVYPAEVEAALQEHPAVIGTVVFGVEDAEWGQIVAALISPTADHEIQSEELVEFLRSRIAAFKIPKAFAFLPMKELPVGVSGKPQRRKAAQMAARLNRIR